MTSSPQSQEHLTADQVYLLSKQRRGQYLHWHSLSQSQTSWRRTARCAASAFPTAPTTMTAIFLPHDHLICEHCGAIKDFKNSTSSSALSSAKSICPCFSFDLNVRYICPECQAKGGQRGSCLGSFSQAIKERENDEDR